jgi:hypothetical protein
MKKGYRSINEELNRMKNLVEYKSGNVLEEQNILTRIFDKVKGKIENKIEDNNVCKGVTVTNPPAYFKTKYVNNSTDLYFYGVTSFEDEGSGYDGNYISKNTKMNHKDCYNNAMKNLQDSLMSNEQPKPIGAIPKQGAIINAVREFELAASENCLNRETKIVILWQVYTISVDNYNRILQFSGPEYSDGIVGTVPASTEPVVSPVTSVEKPSSTTEKKPEPEVSVEKPVTTKPTSTGGMPSKVTHSYPNDKNYGYAKDETGNWWAQNKKSGKWFNLSINPKYKSSVDKLDKGAIEI